MPVSFVKDYEVLFLCVLEARSADMELHVHAREQVLQLLIDILVSFLQNLGGEHNVYSLHIPIHVLEYRGNGADHPRLALAGRDHPELALVGFELKCCSDCNCELVRVVLILQVFQRRLHSLFPRPCLLHLFLRDRRHQLFQFLLECHGHRKLALGLLSRLPQF